MMVVASLVGVVTLVAVVAWHARMLSIARMPCRVVLLGFDWCEKAWSYSATCWLQKFVWQ